MSQNGLAHLPFWDKLSTLRHYEAFNGNKTEHATIVTSLQNYAKKRNHKRFPGNFVKNLRTAILNNTIEKLLSLILHWLTNVELQLCLYVKPPI